MKTGLVWPMPGNENVFPNPNWAKEFKNSGISFIRMDVPVSRDRKNAQDSVQVMLDAGLDVLPILSWPYYEPDVSAMQDYAQWYIETFPYTSWITLGNEPWILDKIHADEYLRIAEPMAIRIEALRSDVNVVFAMDLFDHVSGNSRNWPGVEKVIECIESSPKRYADIHPYRNPYAPTYSPWGSRDKEHDEIVLALGHSRFIYGEIGWKPNEGQTQASGQCHVDELEIDAHHKIPLVTIYTHIADLVNPQFDFGLWLNENNEVTPRPAALTISNYLDGSLEPIEETTMRNWVGHEVETIRTIMHEDAPWRIEQGWAAGDSYNFVASWLNAVEQLDAAGNLSAESIREWWRSTEEYQNEWPKWEESQKPPTLANPIIGQLRVHGGGYSDDSGPVLPIGLHLGDIFSKFTRDQDHARRYLESAAQVGYRIIQFWMNLGTLGGSYWAGREVGPDFTPDFYGQLSRFSDLLDTYKLKGVYNLGDYRLLHTSHDELWSNVSLILKGRDTAAFLFAGNEAWQTGASSGDECWESIRRGSDSGVIRTSTAPPSEEKSDIVAWCRGDFYAIHGYRGGEDHDRLRHIFSVPWEGQPPKRYGYQDEWTGPGNEVSVKPSHCYNGRDVDANHMCAGAFQSLLCNQAFNYFCSEGVKSDGDITKRAGYSEVAKVSNLLPIDIHTWSNPIHFGSTQPQRIFEPSSGSAVRFDHRIAPDGRFAGLLYGDESHVRIRDVRPCELTIWNWDATPERSQHFNQGEELTVDLVRSQGGNPGRTALPITGRL